eukprot:gene21163-biopygen7179
MTEAGGSDGCDHGLGVSKFGWRSHPHLLTPSPTPPPSDPCALNIYLKSTKILPPQPPSDPSASVPLKHTDPEQTLIVLGLPPLCKIAHHKCMIQQPSMEIIRCKCQLALFCVRNCRFDGLQLRAGIVSQESTWRIPMCAAPTIMHRITAALAMTAAKSIPVRTRAFVDNVRFVGSKEDVRL